MCYKHASSCGVSAAAVAKCLAVWGCWAIAELQATGAKGYWVLFWLSIFGTRMHAGMQLEELKIKRTG